MGKQPAKRTDARAIKASMYKEVRAGGQYWDSRMNLEVGVNEPPPDSLGRKLAHELFEDQAARMPEQVAAIDNQQQLTYRELNAQANQLAHHLRQAGVGPETLVAVCLDRGTEMVRSILAVLKAGGAHLPLDPTYPRDRLALMLDDARPTILLTKRALSTRLPGHRASVVLLDEHSREIASQTRGNPARVALNESLAYVIYTSGSTGKPKGVMIEHGNLARYVQSMRQAVGIEPSHIYLHTASISFSSSVRQLMLPLSTGATVVVASHDEVTDPVAIFALIKRQGVTVIDIVPSYWRNCIAALESLSAGTRDSLLDNKLRLLLSASEPLPSDLPRAWRNCLGRPMQLINMFGQTETTGIVATYPIISTDESKATTVPLGRPIAGVRIHLLDRELQPVGARESGEICISGPTVGRGYLNQPELTAVKFVKDPLSESASGRLYRTGDRGRFSADGQLEFLGRLDNQVKIRGHRVEPGEIEATLLENPSVSEVVVLARQDESGNSRLFAFVVPHQAHAVSLAGRERYRLPNNMAVLHQNKHETDFFYQQIFVEQTDFRHGISLRDGACVFDVGANIGLFTLFVQQICKGVKVYAFEPVPVIFEALKVNCSLYGRDVKPYQCGLGAEEMEAGFTFYPHSTSQSGLYADETDEREVLRSIIGNAKLESGSSVPQYLEALVEARVVGEKMTCRLRTGSDIIREEAIERIDLLKIDVEKSEADVLAGIREDDWPKIQQIVIEAHDKDGRLAHLLDMLKRRGYCVVADQDRYLKGSNLFNIYAMRDSAPIVAADRTAPYHVPVLEQTIVSAPDLRRRLQERLPEYLVPAELVILESLPRLPNGKIDRQALASLERIRVKPREDFVSARSPVEQKLAQIWSEVLKCEAISVDDNFFDLGGDSILVTQIVARASRAGLRLTPKHIFKYQTIARISEALVTLGEAPI